MARCDSIGHSLAPPVRPFLDNLPATSCAKSDTRQVATGHIVAVTVAREGWDPAPIPDALRQLVEAFEGSRVA